MTESFKQISDRLLNCSNYEQAEEVERDIEKLVEIHHELEQENKELVEALAMYADNKNWGYVCNDEFPEFQVWEDRNDSGEYKNLGGKKARQVLAKRKKGR